MSLLPVSLGPLEHYQAGFLLSPATEVIPQEWAKSP